MDVLAVNRRIRIPLSELAFTYARSGGPGGQNVNKVNSKAVLRWPVRESPHLPADVRARFLAAFGSRLTTTGELVLQSQRYRDQGRNVQDCLDRLRAMLASVAAAPKTRRPTKATRGSVERRLKSKLQRSATKQGRQAFRGDD